MKAPSRAELECQLVRYQHLRTEGRRINDQIVETIPKTVVKSWAAKLGMMKQNVIVFETENEVSILMDAIIHNSRKDGRNMAARFAEEFPQEPGSDAAIFLEGLKQARFLIFQILAPFPGYGNHCKNIFTNEEFFLFDQSFSTTAEPGIIMCSRIVNAAGIHMTTGAGIPVFQETGEQLTEAVQAYARKNPKHMGKLNAEEEAEFATVVIRALLQAHASARIAYQ